MTTPADARALAVKALWKAHRHLASYCAPADRVAYLVEAADALTAEPAVTPKYRPFSDVLAGKTITLQVAEIDRLHKIIADLRSPALLAAEKTVANIGKRGPAVTPDRERLAQELEEAADDVYRRQVTPRPALLEVAAAALRQPVAAEIKEMARRLDALTINRESWGPFVDFADVINEAAALLRRLPPAGDGWRPTHRHYKGGLYRVMARGRIEADLSPVVIYDNEKGETWVRPVDDFDARIGMNHICRFDPLPAPPETTKP